MGICHNNIGNIHLKNSRFFEAISSYQNAVQIIEEEKFLFRESFSQKIEKELFINEHYRKLCKVSANRKFQLAEAYFEKFCQGGEEGGGRMEERGWNMEEEGGRAEGGGKMANGRGRLGEGGGRMTEGGKRMEGGEGRAEGGKDEGKMNGGKSILRKAIEGYEAAREMFGNLEGAYFTKIINITIKLSCVYLAINDVTKVKIKYKFFRLNFYVISYILYHN